MFVVVTDSREDGGILVLMSRRPFWTRDLGKARVFSRIGHAQIQAKKLKFNNPRVLTYAEAYDILEGDIDDHEWALSQTSFEDEQSFGC